MTFCALSSAKGMDIKMIKEQNQEYDSYIDDIVSKSALYWKDGLEPQKRKIDFFPQ